MSDAGGTYLPYQFAGVWRFACRRRTPAGLGMTYTAVGYCAETHLEHPQYCGGHTSASHAKTHFIQYLLREQTKLHVDGHWWNPCVVCWRPKDGGKVAISPSTIKRLRWIVHHVFSGSRRVWLAQKLGYSREVAVVTGRWVYYLCPRHQFRDYLERVIGDPAELMT